jgi:hypothetical protein
MNTTRNSTLFGNNRVVWCYDEGNTGWLRFNDIDNDIIEAAYQRNEKEVELDDAFVDIHRLIRKSKLNLKIEGTIKRENRLIDPVNIRTQRFFSQPKLVKSFRESDSNDHRFIKKWQQQNPRCSVDELLDRAANGILLEGHLLNQPIEAEWISSQLQALKGKSNDEINRVIINIYSRESFLYRALNTALRDNDQSKLNHFGAFCQLLFHCDCSSDLRSFGYQGELYRGAQLDQQTIESYRQAIGKMKTWDAFSSTSKIRATAESFGNVLFIINRAKTVKYRFSGVDISSMSAYPQEEEVLIRAARNFLVEKVEQDPTTNKYLIFLSLC